MIHNAIGLLHTRSHSSWGSQRQKTGKRKTVFIRLPFSCGCTCGLGFSQVAISMVAVMSEEMGYSGKNGDNRI